MQHDDAHDSGLRAALLGQLLNDFFDRRHAGEAVTETELIAAHPELAGDLRCSLEVLQNLGASPGPIHELIAKGILARSSDPHYVAELGGYEILGVRGRGGMGMVLKAHDPSLDRAVALKLLRPDLMTDTAALARFEREAKAAANLKHPNIVTVYGVGEAHGAHYIAMEYVDGPSLAELIRGASPYGPHSCSHGPEAHAPLVRRIFRELLLALDAAHRAGLIHRDVKSPNILLASGELSAFSHQPADGPEAHAPVASMPSCLPLLKLADFGLARMRSSQTQVTLDGSILGTPEYMSPEQARGDADIDHRTDLYSAGVVLYEMLTGQTPFHCDTPTATIHRILHEEPPDPRKLDKSVDPVLASLALRLMAKRREERFADAAAALRALDRRRPISRPSHRRLSARHLVAAGIILAAVALTTWRVAPRAPHSSGVDLRVPHAAQASMDVDGRGQMRIWVHRTPDGPAHLLHQFPPEAGNRIAQPQLVDADGRGRFMIVAGTSNALEGNCVFAFDPDGDGQPLWTLDLTSPSDEIYWPDISFPSAWICRALLPADLDGRPGDELLESTAFPSNPYSAIGSRCGVMLPLRMSMNGLMSSNVTA